MPHIHNEPDQHDMTVSGYVVRLDGEEPLCLLHMHRKMGKLMQIGGHIELNETPWQSMGHELTEESGYRLHELKVVQANADKVAETDNVSHPTPFSMNTHSVGNQHFHSDLCYGFVAVGPPSSMPADGESADLRWLSLADMQKEVEDDRVVEDTWRIYEYLVRNLNNYAIVDAKDFSIGKPTKAMVTYTYGAPGH